MATSTNTALEVIDVLDVHYHIDGVRMTEICLMSDGSVVAHVSTVDIEGNALSPCDFEGYDFDHAF